MMSKAMFGIEWKPIVTQALHSFLDEKIKLGQEYSYEELGEWLIGIHPGMKSDSGDFEMIVDGSDTYNEPYPSARSYCSIIFKWCGVYYKFNYEFNEFYGYDFDSAFMQIVTPKQVTITIYEVS